MNIIIMVKVKFYINVVELEDQGYTGVFFDGRDEDALFCLSGGSYQT